MWQPVGRAGATSTDRGEQMTDSKTRSRPAGAPDPVAWHLLSVEEVLRSQDAVVIVTDHSAVDYEAVARHAGLVVDTRGVYRAPRSNVVKA